MRSFKILAAGTAALAMLASTAVPASAQMRGRYYDGPRSSYGYGPRYYGGNNQAGGLIAGLILGAIGAAAVIHANQQQQAPTVVYVQAPPPVAPNSGAAADEQPADQGENGKLCAIYTTYHDQDGMQKYCN